MVGAEVAALGEVSKGREIGALISAPEMVDPASLVVMSLLEELSMLGMFFSPAMVQVVTMKMVNLSLRLGNSRVAPSAYARYGMILGSGLGDFEGGYSFGTLAIELSRKYGDRAAECKATLWMGAFISHWREHMDQGMARLREAMELGLRSGELGYAAYAALFLAVHTITRGVRVPDAKAELQRCAEVFAVDRESVVASIAYRQLLLCMEGATRGRGDLENPPAYVEAEHLEQMRQVGTVLCFQHYYNVKLLALLVFERAEDALKTANAARDAGNIELILFAQLTAGERSFLDPLVRAAAYHTVPEGERAALLADIEASRAKLERWAANAPANFRHKEALVAAELARLTGRDLEAQGLYNQAIAGAEASGILHNEAIANELCGRFHLQQGRRGVARGYLRSAYEAYARWGATGKTRMLEERYPELLPAGSSAGGTRSLAQLDLTTVTKAAQAMSGEIVLDRLLERMLGIIVENAGAQRGFLVLERDGDFVIEAAGEAQRKDNPLPRARRLDEGSELSAGIVKYVARTGERVVLDDAANEGRFQADPYVLKSRPKSVLCMPITRQGKRVGIVYVENNLVTGAFTPGRLEVLEVLGAQAAISLENARLYETLEHKVEERTRELQEKNRELEAAMQRLVETRQQLVVQEKLASLGALTAGIAHELKNPLNFVNNFAEVSDELAAELREELEGSGDTTAALAVLDDLGQSLQKIKQHGKRADSVVKAMLEHARTGSGQREPTDLNTLVSEFLGLAYQGLRSRDPNFNVALETSFDAKLQPIEVVPQDISRVVLNLIDNAWYATRSRGQAGVAPTIWVSTRDAGESVEIRVRDNGSGIPASARERIFTPFFTTKPTGKGTGLGLSICHDIIVQGNGGTLRFETEEGKGTEFIIALPKQQVAKAK
jgi:signal transduction histidine kinase